MFNDYIKDNRDDLVPLDPERMSTEAIELEHNLLKRVIGQDLAVQKLVHTYQTFRSGLQTPNRPLGVLLFLGPTGSGKTRLAEALAEALFNNRNALTKIDCGEFLHDHEVAKLIGSPPGYVGHDKTVPRLSQESLDKYQTKDIPMSILLFDEIEKGCEELHQMLLGILSGARLILGTNQIVDFTKTLIIMTSNEGSDNIQKIISGEEIGFSVHKSSEDEIDALLWDAAKDALKKKFTPEFLNRITKCIVFHSLNEESLKQIINIEIEAIQDRILAAGYFILISVTDSAKDYIRKEGTDFIYGARELNRALDRLLVEPTSNLLATKQINTRDLLIADYESGDHLIFHKLEGVIEPPPQLE